MIFIQSIIVSSISWSNSGGLQNTIIETSASWTEHLYTVVYLLSYKIYNPGLNNMCVQDRCPLDQDPGFLEYRG